MSELIIEKSLKKADDRLYHKYSVLKDRLLTTEYSFWAGAFPGGNDHGPEHIKRVLEKLDKLLGPKPLRAKSVNAYELFLAMMAILYHDVGILRQRKGHASLSKLFLQMDQNEFIFEPRDKEVISVAVVSHSSSKDIDIEAKAFAKSETIGGQTVRPRLVAALVRFADELDEDFRRANSTVAALLNLPKSSEFYWQFCQRIQGIEPRPSEHEIIIFVQFDNEDIGRMVEIEGKEKSFILGFAEKLAKINEERLVVNRFLPEELQYHNINVQVKPLRNHDKWQRPRLFVFTDGTLPVDFVAAYPELLLEPLAKRLEHAITSIQNGEFDKADAEFQQLDKVSSELPGTKRLRIVYLKACIASLRAKKASPESASRRESVEQAVEYLKEWLKLVEQGSFLDLGDTANNAIHKMSRDEDLECLFRERREAVVQMIPVRYHSTLPREWLPQKKYGGGGGGGGGSGCVPAGTMIQTPDGELPIEDLREGGQVLSVDLNNGSGIIVARIVQMHSSPESECIRLNGMYTVTPTQPFYETERGWMRAGDLTTNMRVLDKEMRPQCITHIERLKANFHVYTMTTDHPSHNFVAYGLICSNAIRK